MINLIPLSKIMQNKLKLIITMELGFAQKTRNDMFSSTFPGRPMIAPNTWAPLWAGRMLADIACDYRVGKQCQLIN